MKLLVYGTDGSAPIQFNDVAKIERVFSDGSTKTMKVVPAPLQFTHDPADDWTMIMTDHDGRPVEETLPEPGEFFMISFRDKDGDCFAMGAYHYHANEWYYHNDADEISNIHDTVYAWKPWPDPAPFLKKEQKGKVK